MSLQQIKVSREEVLSIVKDNKEKHDQILKEAIEGYWLEAELFLKKNEKDQLQQIDKNHREALKRLRNQRKDAAKTLKTQTKYDFDLVSNRTRDKGFKYWNGKYPEDHGDDYTGTIRRLELCVEPQVELDTNEFDAFIRNKWTWRNSFLSSNTSYVNACYGTSSYSLGSNYAISGSWSCQSISGSYALTGSALLANF